MEQEFTLRAIKNCMDDAMDQLITAAGEASVLDAHSNQSFPGVAGRSSR